MTDPIDPDLLQARAAYDQARADAAQAELDLADCRTQLAAADETIERLRAEIAALKTEK